VLNKKEVAEYNKRIAPRNTFICETELYIEEKPISIEIIYTITDDVIDCLHLYECSKVKVSLYTDISILLEIDKIYNLIEKEVLIHEGKEDR